MRRGDKEFQELVDEMVADILQRDMDAAGEKARKQAENEHKASRETAAPAVHESREGRGAGGLVVRCMDVGPVSRQIKKLLQAGGTELNRSTK